MKTRRLILTTCQLALTLFVGVVIGVFFHYLLYRIFLPVEPFIYAAF